MITVLIFISLVSSCLSLSSTPNARMQTSVPISTPNPPHNNNNNLWLVVDFDGTCSVKDTTPLLPRIAQLFYDVDGDEERGMNSKYSDINDRMKQWNMHESEYFELYKKVQTQIFEGDQDDDDDEGMNLESALQKLDDISTTITHQVSESQVLKGIPTTYNDEDENSLSSIHQTLNDYFSQGELDLQDDCLNVLQKAIFEQKLNFRVLSINWSPILIASTLLYPLYYGNTIKSCDATKTNTKTPSELLLFNDEIIQSNQVDKDGVVNLLIPGAIEKQIYIQQLFEAHNESNDNNNNNNECRVVYIGDSVTDMLAMLKANVGILVGNSQSVRKMAKRFHVSLKPLSLYYNISNDGGYKEREENEKIIWVSESWKEIGIFLEEYSKITVGSIEY